MTRSLQFTLKLTSQSLIITVEFLVQYNLKIEK